MKYLSAFEIIGPTMVGPSSSHTAGAVRIGNIARQILAEVPKKVEFQLMGSFAETYQGHGTDLALLAGILGMPTDDERVAHADQWAIDQELDYRFLKRNRGDVHPNTVFIQVSGATRSVHMLASSLGGGKAEVQELDGLPVRFTGEKPTLILYHQDQQGFLAKVSRFLDGHGYNIARLTLERAKKGGAALTVCGVDEPLQKETLTSLKQAISILKEVRWVQVV